MDTSPRRRPQMLRSLSPRAWTLERVSAQFTTEWLTSRLARESAANPAQATIDPDAVKNEAELHELIISECRRRRWQFLHGAMSERTSRTLGEPDFIVLADRERVFFIECKSRLGKLSPEQRAFKVGAAINGHTIHIVRSFQEFMEITKL